MSGLFRDLVEGECAEPNALGGFVQNFTTDKSGLYHDKWEMNHHMENHDLYGMEQHHNRFNDNQLDKIFDGSKLDNINDLLDDGEFQHHHQQHHPLQQPHNIEKELQFFLQDFIMSTKNKHLMKPVQLNIPLSHPDKAKIRNRSEVMFKHFQDPELDDGAFTHDQLLNLFDSLGITEEDTFDDLDQHWGNDHDDYDQFGENQPQLYDQVWENPKQQYIHQDQEHNIEDDYWNNVWDNQEEDDMFDDIENEDFNPFESAWKDSGVEFEDKSLDAAWGETARKSLRDVTRPITNIKDPKIRNSNFAKFMSQLGSGEAQVTEDEEVIFHDPQQFTPQPIDIEQGNVWADEYQDHHETVSNERLYEYHFAISQAREADTFERGMDLFNDGLIDDSILALESEVMRNPENAEAWMYLGIAHAENDKDQQAISCLHKSIQLDPSNLNARIALSVSYTNDYQKERALDTLQEWLKRNPTYSHLQHHSVQFNEGQDISFMDTWKRHTVVTEMFLEAARLRPNSPDPDVQTVLGLLYNMSYEYEKAVDCFKAALQNKPEDYQLWNKLGATLANSNRAKEALGAYFKALEQKPSYVRARSNLGISYLTLNMFEEAATNFLGALHIHPGAVHIWDNLKMVFRLMNREDLIVKSESRDTSQFINDFKFV